MSDKMPAAFHVKVNQFEFDINQEEIDAASYLQVTETDLHLIHQQQSVTAQLLQADQSGKQQELVIEGENYAVQISDELDQMLGKMGYSTDAGKKVKEIKAPMPGLVLQVNVAEGQVVNAGEKLLILVAMKMENSILSPAKATIKRIAVAAEQAVEKGQLLIELD